MTKITNTKDKHPVRDMSKMKVLIIPWLDSPIICTPEMAEKIKKKYSELTDLIAAARESTRI